MARVFRPSWAAIKACLDRVCGELGGDDAPLIDAYCRVALRERGSVSALELYRELQGEAIVPGTPWIVFDTLSQLLGAMPMATRRILAAQMYISSDREGETLAVRVDGRWQVAWDGKANEAGEGIALDWYSPPERDRAPIVPAVLMEYIAGCMRLLRHGQTLPAGALLMIALEAVLWDELSERGVERTRERVTLASAVAQYRVVGDQIVLRIRDSDEAVALVKRDLHVSLHAGEVTVQRIGDRAGGKAVVQMEVDSLLAPYLSSSRELSRETVAEKGLADAITRARALGVLRTIPSQLDTTLYRLRNALVHVSTSGALHSAIPLPGGAEFATLDTIEAESRVIVDLVTPIANLINDVYSSRVESPLGAVPEAARE